MCWGGSGSDGVGGAFRAVARSMAVATGAERAVTRLADGVMDGGDARPVVDRLSQFVRDGEAADHLLGAARLGLNSLWQNPRGVRRAMHPV